MHGACELILITGFLGAGKTTLLRNLLPLYADKRIHLIVNEFGSVGMDGALLAHLGASMKEIVNGSIFCACRLEQFEMALEEAQAKQPELLFVETSGLSDPTAIRTLLEQGARYPGLRYRGCIALADATSLHRVIDTARVCRRQLSIADLILMTKTDIATPQQIATTENLLRKGYPETPVVNVIHGEIPIAVVDALSTQRSPQAGNHWRDLTLQKYTLEVSPDMGIEQLRAFLRMFAEDTYRIKGFVALREGAFQLDCVGAYIEAKPVDDWHKEHRLAVLAGEGMPLRKSLKEALRWYIAWVKEVPSDE